MNDADFIPFGIDSEQGSCRTIPSPSTHRFGEKRRYWDHQYSESPSLVPQKCFIAGNVSYVVLNHENHGLFLEDAFTGQQPCDAVRLLHGRVTVLSDGFCLLPDDRFGTDALARFHGGNFPSAESPRHAETCVMDIFPWQRGTVYQMLGPSHHDPGM